MLHNLPRRLIKNAMSVSLSATSFTKWATLDTQNATSFTKRVTSVMPERYIIKIPKKLHWLPQI